MTQPDAKRHAPWAVPAAVDPGALRGILPELEGDGAPAVFPDETGGDAAESLRHVGEGTLRGIVLPLDQVPNELPPGVVRSRIWVPQEKGEPATGGLRLAPDGALMSARPEILLQVHHDHPDLFEQLVLAEADPTEGSPLERGAGGETRIPGPGDRRVHLLPALGMDAWVLLAREEKPPREAPPLTRREESGPWAAHRALGGFLTGLRGLGGAFPCATVRHEGFNLVLDAFAWFPRERRTVRHRMIGPGSYASPLGRRTAQIMYRAGGHPVPPGFPGLPR